MMIPPSLCTIDVRGFSLLTEDAGPNGPTRISRIPYARSTKELLRCGVGAHWEFFHDAPLCELRFTASGGALINEIAAGNYMIFPTLPDAQAKSDDWTYSFHHRPRIPARAIIRVAFKRLV